MAKIDLTWVARKKYKCLPQHPGNLHRWSYTCTTEKNKGFAIHYDAGNTAWTWMIEYYETGNEHNALAFFDKNRNIVKVTTRNATYTAPRYTERWKTVFEPIIDTICYLHGNELHGT